MAVDLPVTIPQTTSWQLVDWIERKVSTDPAAGGIATVELDQLDGNIMWLVDRAVAYCDSTTDTQMRLYVDAVDPRQLRDGTETGNLDVTEYPTGLLVRPGSYLIAQWAGCSDGAIGYLTLQGRKLVQV